uniref:Immunoglobulin-like beta-sandwich domain-containing protein n=1 Tax=Panthera leo TaxID=9689 RepID=A0A8C9DBT2_PANLE
MVRLRPGRGKRGRPSLLSRWTTYHESFFPEFFIQRIWTQVGGPPVLCSSLSAWPSPVVPQGQCVTLQCHSHCRFGMFRLYKVTGALIPELHSIILQDSFLAGPVTPAHAGTYRCCGSYLGSSSVWSPPSDPLLIVVTGVYRKPSLSAQPGPLVKSEGNMTFFVLHSEELSKAPWHLPGQPHREGSHANFIMGPVTAAHAGTYRCFGFLNHSFYEWSTPRESRVNVHQWPYKVFHVKRHRNAMCTHAHTHRHTMEGRQRETDRLIDRHWLSDT